ncbi:MAG: hydantoin utilization protein A [Planctomycetota bacterium]|nr:MAG: hydantoin utilization protein A [Planctomycetota bacterium]
MLSSLLLGSFAGAQHALGGPDHLAGVAPFAAARAHRAWHAGLAWGVGHAAGACVAALAALVLRDSVPGLAERVSERSELAVGVVLCIIGALGLRALVRDHAHAHAPSSSSLARCLGIGALHGAAGLSHLFAVLPALALASPAAYLAGYGISSTLAMCAVAAGVGRLTLLPALRRRAFGVCSAASVLVGAYWIAASV